MFEVSKLIGLRYKDDLRTLGFGALYVVLVAVQFSFDFSSFWLRFAFFIATSFSCFQGAVSVHNAVHCPTFQNMTVNAAFQIFLSCWFGHMASSYVPGHNLSHHRNLQSTRDVMRTTKMQYKWNFLNMLLFAPATLIVMNKNDQAYFDAQKRLNRPIYKQFRREMCTYISVQILLGYLSPFKWLTVCWLPHTIGKYMIVTLNMLQHDGCDENSKYNHSRNFVSPTLNYLCFNNGYHSIHHIYPGKHWSLLKDEHDRRLAPHIYPELDDPSIWGYMFKAYVYPGRRITYDGKPYDPPHPGPDEPWYYETTESYSDRQAPSYTAMTNPQDSPLTNPQGCPEHEDAVRNKDLGGPVGDAWGRGLPLDMTSQQNDNKSGKSD